MKRRILKFNPRYEDIPERIRNSYGELKGINSHSPYSKIVTVFLKRLKELNGLDAVIINESFWLENYGWFAIETVERIASNLGLEFWRAQGMTAEFCYSVLTKGATVDSKDYRNVFNDSDLGDWEERL